MEPNVLALTLARGLLRQEDARFELCDGEPAADGTPLDAFPASPAEDVRARLAFLAHRLGLGDVDPGHLALAWQSALAARPHTRRELLDVARRLSRRSGDDPLDRWRDALRARLAPTLDSVPHVDAFGSDTPGEVRRDHLELRPLLDTWPRRLLNDREWAYTEAPLPEMEPLPLARAWVDVDLVEPDELTFPAGGTVLETLDRRYEERAWRSEPADLLLERLGSSAALVGPPGSGKTTLLKWLARFLVTRPDGRFLLPLFVPLRAYVTWQERHREGGLLEFALIQCGVRDPGQQKLWINTLSYLSGVESEHVLLLLDGWDEVPSEKREALRAEVADLLYGFSALVTSRPSAYPRNLPTDHFYEIAELSPEAVDVLVRRWFQAAEGADEGPADAVLRQIERRGDLRRMARNPFLLTLLCGIAHRASRSGPAELSLPSCRSQIYARAMELIFTHHNQRFPGAPLDAARQRQTERLALWLLAEAPEAPRYVFSQHDVVASGGDAELLERRLKPARLLSQWSLGDDSHHFLHTTFHEYLAARALAREAPGRADARLREHVHDIAWQEVFLFLAGGGGAAAETFWRAMASLARRPDRFGLVWARLARLVAEAGAGDPAAAADGGRSLLGLDLRDRLWQGLLETPINTPFVEAYAELDAAGFVARAEEALPGAGERQRVRLVRALGRMRGPDASRSLVDQILQGDDNDAAVAFYQVYRRIDGEGLRRLRAAARDPARDVTFRRRAVRALGHARDSLSVPQLAETARREDALARDVAQALGRIGGAEAVRALAELLHARRNPDLESAVFSVLGEIRDSGARDLLLTEVAGRPPDDPRLVEILEALCEIPIHRGAGVLLGILRGEGPSEVRRAAVWALMEASAFGVGDALAEAARRDEDRGVRTAALNALEKRARPVDAGWLARHAADAERDGTERSLALRALLLTVPRFAAETEGERVRALAAWQVQEALKESEDDLALEAAIHAHHAGVEIGPRLVEIVLDEKASGPVREMACGSLGRLRFQAAVEPLLALVRKEPEVEPDEDLPEGDPARRCAQAAAEALVRIDVAALLGEPGATAAHALARFSVETGCLVFDDRVVGPDGKVRAERTEPDVEKDEGIEDETTPASAAPVDLVLHVETTIVDGKTHLSYVLDSPSGKVPYTRHRILGPPFPMAPAEYQASLFEGIEKLHSGVASDGSLVSDEEIGTELEKLGRELYKELFTSEMRAAYRAFRDRVETFLIVSYESWIPWELVKPYDDRDPERIVDDDFLGCRFQLTRWLAGETTPAAAIAVRRLAVVEAGSPDGAEPLAHAQKERDFLVGLATGHGIENRSPPATFPAVENVLREEGIGLLHFVGHGQLMPNQPDLASFLLEDGRTLRPIDLQGEVATNLRRGRPLVFLNACQMGRAGWARTRLGGWAPRWIVESRCGAFVGPQWTVSDTVAFRFAELFYDQLKISIPFGEAARSARRTVWEEQPGNPGCLAYAVYAHPNGRLVLDGKEPSSGPRIPVSEIEVAPEIRRRIHRFDGYIAEKAAGFVGRQWLFAAIDRFTEENSRGYFLLSGDPGIGKTALLAQMVRQRSYPHHFNIRADGISRAEDFLANISAQLVAIHALPHTSLPPEATQDGNFLRTLLEEISAKLLPQQGKLIILVDALDEADTSAQPDGANPLYLPLSLPQGVYVVVTLRRGTRLRVECELEQFDISRDKEEDNLADVRAYVEGHLARPGIRVYIENQGLTRETFCVEMVAKSQGNFMYLRHILPEIEKGAYQDRAFGDLPIGLENYYENHWSRMRSRDVWFDLQLPVLIALTVVKEPVPVDLITDFSGVEDPRRVRDVLVKWDAFLYSAELMDEETGERQKHYRLYHESFHDFIAAKDELAGERVDLKAAHSKISDVLWKELYRGE